MTTPTPTVQLPPATASAIANAQSANTLYPLCYGYMVGLLLKVEAITEVSERFPNMVSPEVAAALRQTVNAFRAVDSAKEDRMAEIIYGPGGGPGFNLNAKRAEATGMHHQNLS
jgi:hypothetical protein